MKCDSRTIVREYLEEFDEVTADLNECELEEIMQHKKKITAHHAVARGSQRM